MDNLFPGCIFLGIIGFIVFMSYISYQEKKRKTASWQKFAASNQLDFTPASLFAGARVAGNYQGYHLELDTYESGGKNSKTYTRIVLSTNYRLPKNKSDVNEQIIPEDALSLFTARSIHLKGKIDAEKNGCRMSYRQLDIESNVKYLQSVFDLLCDLANAYPVAVAMGVEVVPALQKIATNSDSKLKSITAQLLQDIEQSTTSQLGHRAQNLLCPRCLTCFDAHKVRLAWWSSITYYGCRTCGQSREFFEGRVVAVLDNATTTAQSQQNSVLRVNWSIHRALFDFDEVQIVQATDEDAERFAVQVGNDTDPLRQPRYKQMRCAISPGCELSRNTLRVLQQMFGSVETG